MYINIHVTDIHIHLCTHIDIFKLRDGEHHTAGDRNILPFAGERLAVVLLPLPLGYYQSGRPLVYYTDSTWDHLTLCPTELNL